MKVVAVIDDCSLDFVDERSGLTSSKKTISHLGGNRRSPRNKKVVVLEKESNNVQQEPIKIPSTNICNWSGCYRSNLITIVSKMNTIELRPAHIEGLKKTPFWKLFEAMLQSKIDQRKCRKFEEFVLRVIRSYDKSHTAFKLGNKLVKLTRNDV